MAATCETLSGAYSLAPMTQISMSVTHKHHSVAHSERWQLVAIMTECSQVVMPCVCGKMVKLMHKVYLNILKISLYNTINDNFTSTILKLT